MFRWEILGYIGASMGAVSLVPEVLKALRTHHLNDLAWGMLFLMLSSSVCWFTYGMTMHVLPLLLSSAINMGMESFLVVLKLRYSKEKMPLFPHRHLKQTVPEEVQVENSSPVQQN